MKGWQGDKSNDKDTNDVAHGQCPERPTAIERLLLRPDEVAIALGVSRSKVYELLGSGELPSLRIGKSIRVSMKALRGWIAQREAIADDGALDIEDGLAFRRR